MRRPRSENDWPSASNSACDQPTPIATVSRPSLSASSDASAFANQTGLCCAATSTLVPMPICRVAAAPHVKREQRVVEVRRRIVLCSRMHDVVADPQVREAERLGVHRHAADRVGTRGAAELREVDADTHVRAPRRPSDLGGPAFVQPARGRRPTRSIWSNRASRARSASGSRPVIEAMSQWSTTIGLRILSWCTAKS